ncbi:MAG: zinc ABC transporter substrate-binding protein [Sphaerochaetaceae bacterium]|nr:zinc ABC transporter substrate-binding protein [Sphaerochaetaceae bacterium]
MKKFINLLILFLLISPIYANGQVEQNEKPVIAVSIVPQATFVEKIAQDKVDIVTMIPKGSSPENYEPTPQQRIEFEKADIYFAIGVPSVEHSILDMVANKTKVVDLSKEVEKDYPAIMIGDSRDPHIWLSPKRVLLMVDVIERELSSLDSENSDFYKANAQSFKDELNQVITKIEDNLSTLKNRNFLVFHPAFSYFAQDFDLNMLSLEEEGKEVTPKSLVEVIDRAKSLGIKNIYYQAEIAAEQSIAYGKELGGEAILLDPLSANYIDNLEIMANTLKENM